MCVRTVDATLSPSQVNARRTAEKTKPPPHTYEQRRSEDDLTTHALARTRRVCAQRADVCMDESGAFISISVDHYAATYIASSGYFDTGSIHQYRYYGTGGG